MPETDAAAVAGAELDEKVDVLVWFKAGKLLPQAFIWNGREYAVKKISYAWKERRGQELLSYFSVDTGANQYQLSFNNASFGWRLDKVIS